MKTDLSCEALPISEWTVRSIAKCYNIDSITATRLAFDINAALDAEREAYALALQMKNIETTRANEAEQQLATQQSFREALRQIAEVEWSSVEVIKQFARESL